MRLAEKPDSQEICFIPGGDYKQFLTAYLEEQGEPMPETAGELVASNGEVLGRHEGIFNFTVGQRKGLRSLRRRRSTFCRSIRRATASRWAPTPSWPRAPCAPTALNWISIPELTAPMRVKIKIRHRHEPAWATLEPAGATAKSIATFDEPQRAVTPGQSAVFYDGDEVVGGGWIL